MRETLRKLVTSKQWEATIITLIVINAITLGMETSGSVVAIAGPVLETVDKLILAVFTIEIALRIFVHRARFFADPWSLFDFSIVAIALMPNTGALSVMRALRILRVLRLISIIPSLRRVIGGLVAALPGMGSIVLLMTLIFYVFSVMATKLYGENFPDWFGTIALSAYTLFQIMTLESWSMGIVRPVMEVHPNAWMFFMPFILSTAFTVLNLFIGIIVSAMQQEHEVEAAADREAIHTDTALMLEEIRALRGEVATLSQKLERDPR